MYCVACDKVFAKQTVFDAHLSGKKHAKAAEALRAKQAAAPPHAADLTVAREQAERAEQEELRAIALMEARIYRLAELLGEQRAATKGRVERRLALTAAELEEEMNADEVRARGAAQAAARAAASPTGPCRNAGHGPHGGARGAGNRAGCRRGG